jgi:hypothetical protein
MPYFIFNQNDKQRADFYESQITDVQILWQGESVDAFIAETGFSIAQLGGFALEEGILTFDQALKDAHDAPQEVPQTPQDKLRELTALMGGLDLQTQALFLPVSSGVATALNAGNVPLAVFVVNGIDTQGDPQLEALKNAVLAILEA